MKIVERLRQFIDYKDISLNNFNKEISAGTGYIEKQIQRNGSIGGDKLETIIKVFPDLNPIWLLTGEGEMLKTDSNNAHSPAANSLNEPYLMYGKQIAREPQEGFVRKSVRNLSGKGPKSGKNHTSEKCEKCVEKERIIEANLTTIKQMEGRLADKDQIIRSKDELIEALRHENSLLSQDSGKRQRDAS